jgi:hypothetical protein
VIFRATTGEGAVALTAPLDPIGMDEGRVSDPAPFPHEPRDRLQRDRRRGFGRAAALRIGAGLLELPCGRRGEAAIRPLLKLVGDPSGQEIAGEPHRRRHAMKPPPLAAQLEDGHLREPRERLVPGLPASEETTNTQRFEADSLADEPVVGEPVSPAECPFLRVAKV